MLKKQKILIVDGYNVLRCGRRYAQLAGAAPNFKDWTCDIWNAAREALLNDVLQLIDKSDQAFIVYDAADRRGNVASPDFSTTKVKNVEIIFTDKDESADSRIQKLSHNFRVRGMEVQIVSSDLGIQDATVNTNVTRTSSREFANTAEEDLKQIQTISSISKGSEMRSKIEDVVDPQTAEKLRALRDSL